MIKQLSNGYTEIWLNQHQWARVPPGFTDETIPDESIFEPGWNRDIINRIWRERSPSWSGQ